ncbi:MAG: aldose 1-epimerase family protein [Spirochaetaceae bacterium]|nr:MAG: aldose 1-epimerase family protein [Spirochaetaceae bacterium]
MAEYLGRRWKKQELISLIGDPQQIAGITRCTLDEGKAAGVQVLQVNTGGGLQFNVLPGRGMDIAGAYFQGNALGFLSPTGITSPAYYEEPDLGWLRSFYAGLLTTCGITTAGAPSVDQGQSFGLHGRISNAAAEDISVEQEWDGDEYRLFVKGKMREAKAMGESLLLTRTVETQLGARGFTIEDRIENRGFEEQPLMMLYHFNFGFPLLGAKARVFGPIRETVARDEEARKDRGVEEALIFPEPIQGYQEKVFFHNLAADSKGDSFIALLNRDIGNGKPLGMILRFNTKELPELTEWKMPRRGFYVMGLEPGTVTPVGRGPLREAGKLPMLAGQTEYRIRIRFEVLASAAEMERIEKEAEGLLA